VSLEIADLAARERYAETCRANPIDVAVMSELSKADLERLGVLLGRRKIMLRAIAAASWRRGRKHCPTVADESGAEELEIIALRYGELP
jgi:hypothetical protein